MQRNDDLFDDTIGFDDSYSPSIPPPKSKQPEKEDVVSNGRLKNSDSAEGGRKFIGKIL